MTPSKTKRSKKGSDDRSWSSTTTCIALAIAWAAIVWALAANAYHVFEARSQDVPVIGGGGRRVGLGRLIAVFFYKSVAQLPNAVQVISHAVAEAKWIPCVLIVGEVGILILWFVLTRLERQMASEARRRDRL